MTTICRWCAASGPLTAEHVFPNWLNSIFGTPTVGLYSVTWRHDYRDQAMGQRTYRMPRIDQTVKTVCEPCNGVWMSKYESQVKPLLAPLMLDDGTTSSITPADQLTISAWAVMKAGVAEDLGGREVIRSDQRQTLRNGGIPAASRVHLARYGGQKGPVMFQRINGQAPAGHELAGAMAGATVTVLGSLAIYVYLGPDESYNAAAGSGERRPTWVSTWPPMIPDAVWPPAEALDERGVVELLAEMMPGSGADVGELMQIWDDL